MVARGPVFFFCAARGLGCSLVSGSDSGPRANDGITGITGHEILRLASLLIIALVVALVCVVDDQYWRVLHL